MSLLALSGSVTLVLPKARFARVVPLLVALAAGTLIGGALLPTLPEAGSSSCTGITATGRWRATTRWGT